MKQKDLILIGFIVVVSAIISIIVSNLIFGSPKNRQQEAEIVQPITAEFAQPDNRFFNNDAFDPTKQITIGENANADPFSGSQ